MSVAYLWSVNAGAAEMAANSMISLRKAAGADARLIAGCIDEEAADIISAHVPDAEFRFLRDTPLGSRFALDEIEGAYGDFRSQKFKATATARYAFIDQINREGLTVLYSDADIAFQADPTVEMRRLSRRYWGRIVAQEDTFVKKLHPKWQSGGGRFALFRKPGQTVCTGLLYWPPARANAHLSKLIVETALSTNKQEPGGDQSFVNRFRFRDAQRIVLAPLRLFPNGSLCFKNDGTLKPAPGVEGFDITQAVTLHANFMVGMEAKKRALTLTGHWHL